MEAEFIRKYLEYWGGTGTEYIQGQIDALTGSEVIWFCNDRPAFETTIKGVVRLSHEASNDLWQDPESLEEILINREGLVLEWVGEFDETDESYFYIGFCGWGPDSLGEERYTYYRYLIQFEIHETFTTN